MLNLLEQFFKDVGTIVPLTIQEEKELSKKLQKCSKCCGVSLPNKCVKCREIIHTFVLKNLPLVVRVAQRYRRDEFDLDDLVGFGIPGVFRAAIKFDYTKNVPFASYASMWIKDYILKAIRTCGDSPKIPLYTNRKLYLMARAKKEISNTGSECTPKLIASKMDLPVTMIEELDTILRKWISLEELENVEDPQPSPEQEFIEKERNQLIEKELKRLLPEDQFQVICSYFGLLETPQVSLTDIATTQGASLHIVTSLKNKAITTLKVSPVMKILYGEI